VATRNKASPTFTPPFGYGEVVPLQRTDRVILPVPGGTPDFCRSINALALSITEFNSAARDYPIVFASADGGKTCAPVIVLGLADGQNLFVDAAGKWEVETYLPAFVRRYPFCISKFHLKGEQRSERVVCIASSYLSPQGMPLFDAAGEPMPQWQAAERLLQEYENDLDATAQMCALFGELSLFSPFTFRVMQDEVPGLTLQGMHRIDEEKLKALKPGKHKTLVSKGLMGKIYAHMHSLENFARLYRRAVARASEKTERKRL